MPTLVSVNDDEFQIELSDVVPLTALRTVTDSGSVTVKLTDAKLSSVTSAVR